MYKERIKCSIRCCCTPEHTTNIFSHVCRTHPLDPADVVRYKYTYSYRIAQPCLSNGIVIVAIYTQHKYKGENCLQLMVVPLQKSTSHTSCKYILQNLFSSIAPLSFYVYYINMCMCNNITHLNKLHITQNCPIQQCSGAKDNRTRQVFTVLKQKLD